jgi:ubiquinone biosynthesis protein
MGDLSWISNLASECQEYSPSLGKYLAKSLTKISLNPISGEELRRSILILFRDAVHLKYGTDKEHLLDFESTISSLEKISIHQLNQEYLNEEQISSALTFLFQHILETVSHHPQIFELLENSDVLKDILGTFLGKFLPLFQIFPAFTDEMGQFVTHLKEPFFASLYEIPEKDHHDLMILTEKILRGIYHHYVKKSLHESLQISAKGEKILFPLINNAVEHLPPDKCITSLICVLCTPRKELTKERIVSIVLQELGGMYVKLAQVLAEIAPPSMARELRHQQDKLGGIFGSEEKSWNYVIDLFQRESLSRIKKYVEIPKRTQSAFAGASVGAIYELNLSELGREKLGGKTILLKVQRPGLKDLFENQKNTLINILTDLESELETSDLPSEDLTEISSLLLALKRTIINYATQSIGELDFRVEKKNADLIRDALKTKFTLSIPHYYHVESDLSLMEKIEGEKITSVVHSKYLERISIANLVSEAYLYLMFQKGIIWADPHAGNILYDPDKLQVKLIDLNPCFKWDDQTVKVFIGFMIRLILGDTNGVLQSLKGLIEDSNELETPRNVKIIKDFLETGNQGAFIRYLGDFVRLLTQANINLRIEVQAALRGLSQVYITASAISSRHNFGQLFQKQFGKKMLLKQILSIGPVKVIKAALPLIFDVIRNSPEEEVGPNLDERDISAIEEAFKLLNSENVCNIELRRESPDENIHFKLASDGSSLIKSSHLRIELITNTRPASIKYIIEVPQKEWLKERQEYIKLQGLGYAMCLVECMEQLRRHSLENYWHVVEGWNTHASKRSLRANILIGDVRVAARSLFARRYQNIWVSNFMTISMSNRGLWKLLIHFEQRFEQREQGFFYILSKKMSIENVGKYTFGTIHRIKIIIYRVIISWLKTLIKRDRFELNLLPLTTDDLIHRMLHGLLRRGNSTRSL